LSTTSVPMENNKETVRILMLEDSPADAELITRELRTGGLQFEAKRVQTRESFLGELKAHSPSIILADYTLPSFDGMSALALVREASADVPFVFVSGTIGDERAVEAMKAGATDYVLKDKLIRLVPAVTRALQEAKEKLALKRAQEELSKYQSELEHLVQARTAELAEANRKLKADIGERKKVEKALGAERDKLTGIMNSMQDAVCIISPHFVLEYVNPSMLELYGPVEDRKCYEYFNNRDEVCIWCNSGEVLSTGKTIEREVQSNRTGRTYDVTDALLKNSDGSVSKLAVWHDITERKKMEELKDEFIGMVSHELKTPLTVIMGALATVADPRIPVDEVRQLLGDALVSTEVLASLVDNLLELSRQQSNRLFLQAEPSDIREIGRTVLRKLKSKSDIHRLIDDFPEVLPLVVVDPLRVERIFYNPIDNAVKYSPRGGEVRISARQEGDHLVASVSDQGPGISSDDQARLFHSFERLGAPVKGSIQGTGLGLRVCRILVEAHSGRIWVESEKGKGSTFRFTLPVAAGH